jgi:hypothetical protein
MARAVNVCPRCGANVTPYAAGCGVCGADLERLRSRRRPGLPALPRASGDLPQNVLLTTVMFAIAAFAPLYGFLLAVLVAFDRNRRGARTMRNMAVAAGALAVIIFFFPTLTVGALGPVSS